MPTKKNSSVFSVMNREGFLQYFRYADVFYFIFLVDEEKIPSKKNFIRMVLLNGSICDLDEDIGKEIIKEWTKFNDRKR